MASKYSEKTGVKVNVNFDSQATWFEKAKKDADILFGASDQSALAIASDFGKDFNVSKLSLYFREDIYSKRQSFKNQRFKRFGQ